MEPIGNEPHGWRENEESHATHLGKSKEPKKTEIDSSQNDLAGNAVGNIPEENPSHPTNEDPKGFMGDFAEPQHDD